MTYSHEPQHCPVNAVFKVEAHNDEGRATLAAIESYLWAFVAPIFTDFGGKKVFTCFNCGEMLSGFCGRFTWGLTHGEGYCTKCDWPARAYHRIMDGGDEPIATFSPFILSYHPEALAGWGVESLARFAAVERETMRNLG